MLLLFYSFSRSLSPPSLSLHSLKLNSLHSLKLKSQAHSDRCRPDYRQRRRHRSSTSPPSTVRLPSRRSAQTRSSPPIVNVNICFNASQAAAQLRPDRRLPIVATDRQRQHLFQHGPKPLISSDPPPINSFSLRPTAIRLRPTPLIGVLARRRCVCL